MVQRQRERALQMDRGAGVIPSSSPAPAQQPSQHMQVLVLKELTELQTEGILNLSHFGYSVKFRGNRSLLKP